MAEELNFDEGDLAPIEVPIVYQGRRYVLREAPGLLVRRFRVEARKGAKGDQPDPEHLDKAMAGLVSACLFERAADGKEQPVKADELSGWAIKVLEAVYKKALDINRLSPQAEGQEGNGQAPGASLASTPGG